MSPKQLVFRGYCKKDGDQYVAICIDLCLAAQDSSPKEATQKLFSMIDSYIEEAFNEDEAYIDQLLSRKSPIAHRLEFQLIRARVRLSALITDVRDGARLFYKTVPLKPA